VIDERVKIHDLTSKEHGRLRILQRWKALWDELKIIRPDVTVNFNFQSVYFEAIMPKDVRGKIVYSERGDPYDKEYTGVLGVLRTLSFKRTDGFVFQSEGARNFFNNSVKKRSVIIHNPVSIPINRYPTPTVREKIIVSVGRLHPQKNQKLLIEAFAEAHNSLPEYKLEIYGDGRLHDELLSLIKELGINDFATIFPSRNDIWDRLCKAALFVLTSEYEGMPNALMEAMALGLPCISTDYRPDGAKTLIESGINGIIVPRGDVKELAKQMILLLSSHETAKALSIEARSISDTHSEQIIFNMWEKFLQNL
jgi:glycosyltransferase involved in cell wall biosynthesis